MDLKLAVFSEAVLLGTASSISYVGCYNIINAFTFLVHIVTQTVKISLCNIDIAVQYCMFNVYTCSNRTDKHLPNIMWCREPFMEALNEIEDIN